MSDNLHGTKCDITMYNNQRLIYRVIFYDNAFTFIR